MVANAFDERHFSHEHLGTPMRSSYYTAATTAFLAFAALALTAAAQSPSPNTEHAAESAPDTSGAIGAALAARGPSSDSVAHRAGGSDSTHYVPRVLTTRTLAHLGIATLVVTAALTPLDATITRNAQVLRGNGTGPAERVANTLNWIGDPGTVVIPVLLLGTGWVSHNSALREIGLHASESVALSGGVTALVKGLAGRRRPEPGSQDMDDFSFYGGFRGGNASESFPSGHTTAAFALATTLTLETMRFNPNAAKFVAIASYSVATGVGLARVYTNHHWASDVALGAGIGTLGALMVERYAHGGMVRHRTLASMIPSTATVTGDGRTMVGWTIPLSK